MLREIPSFSKNERTTGDSYLMDTYCSENVYIEDEIQNISESCVEAGVKGLHVVHIN